MWKKLYINKQNIKIDTGKSVLINCPNKSIYHGWCFWHPSKLVRETSYSHLLSISYTDNFDFKLIKYGKGKSNNTIILQEKHLDSKDIEDIFNPMKSNIPDKFLEDKIIVDEPNPINPEVVIPDELKN